MVRAGEGDFVGLSVALNGEFLLVQGTDEASIPMEVDPAVRLSLPGDSEFVSKPTYTEVVAGSHAIGQQTAPSCGSAGIEGALGDEALSSQGQLERSAEVTEVPLLFTEPRHRPINLVRSDSDSDSDSDSINFI